MSENFYLLLGLEPHVDDWPVIEARLRECQRRWALQKNQGAPRDRRNAEKYLKLIPEIQVKLSDPGSRRAIAADAEKELKSRKKDTLRKLDELIDVLSDRTLDADTLKILQRQLGGGLGEGDILARLTARGFTVAADNAPASPSKVRSRLDPTIAQGIRDNLRHVQSASLYDFLNLGPRSSPKSLTDAAQELLASLRRKPITQERTVGEELAGQALAVFKTAADKERYDNTCAVEAMEGLREHLELAGRRSFLDQTAIDNLLKLARGKGVRPELALEYIQEFAQKRRWGLQRQGDGPAPAPKVCGFCEALARSDKDSRCHECGEELVQPCPRCGQPTPTENQCCSHCGCATGDAPLVKRLLREGRRLAAQGELEQALTCFDQALVYWEHWPEALEEKRRVEVRRRARDAAFAELDALLHAHRLVQAETQLERLQREHGVAGTEAMAHRVRKGLDGADASLRQAEALLRAGRAEDAVEMFLEALGHCSDHPKALQALSACPPLPPSGLEVTPMGASFRLRWNPVPARGSVSYRVQRKAGGVPHGIQDGVTVAEVTSPLCDDPDVPAGMPWYYAVFTLRSGVASQALGSGPHLRRAEVSDLVVEAGDGQVVLRWTPPQGCTGVEVWRLEGARAPACGQGARVAVAGDCAVDKGLRNGTSHAYRVVACFTDPADDRSIVKSAGVSAMALPVAPPAAVADLHARREHGDVLLSWTPPPRGDVQIRQTTRLPRFSVGRIIALTQAQEYGTLVSAIGPGAAQTALRSQGRVFFIPLSVVEQTAVLGKPVAITTLDEVSHLQSQRVGDNIHLTWAWPTGATEVLVAWSHDACPASPEEAQGGSRRLTQDAYERAGQWTLRNAARARHYFTVFVHDAASGLFSSGARIVEARGLETQIRYCVKARYSLWRRNLQAAWVELQASRDVKELPAVVAVWKRGMPALSAEDGRIVASSACVSFREGSARIELPVDMTKGFVKLFFRDGSHAGEIRLMPAPPSELKIG
jgi:tetratricopeptide (TPR) repeat protein